MASGESGEGLPMQDTAEPIGEVGVSGKRCLRKVRKHQTEKGEGRGKELETAKRKPRSEMEKYRSDSSRHRSDLFQQASVVESKCG